VQRQPKWKPKTKRSVRHVPIAAALRPIRRAVISSDFASDDWLVPIVPRSDAADVARRVCVALPARIVKAPTLIAGIGRIAGGVTYHTLRHTFASWLLMRGTDVFTVAKLLGNTVKQVEDTYGHLALDFRQTAVDRLSEGDQAAGAGRFRSEPERRK
jgi:integrase